MKKNLLSTLIFILILSCGLLASCNSKKSDAGTSAATTTAAPKPDPEPESSDTVINAEYLKDYTIVTTYTADKVLVEALAAGIKEKTGVELKTVVDSASEASEKEILVGKTDRAESVAAYGDIKKTLSYGVSLEGEKLVISYGNDAMLEEAINYILDSFVDGVMTLPENFAHTKEYEMKIDGVGIGNYKIVYSAADEDGKIAAEFLAAEIFKATGTTVNVVTDAEAKGDYEIVIGTTARGEAEACTEYYSYKVRVTGKSFTLSGYDKYALNNAAYGFVNALADAKGEGKTEELNITYTLPAYTEYIDDIDKLYMRWIAEWQPNPRMLDYNEKLDAFRNVSDRLLTCAHRADGYYYPENSLESIISFYKMGGDVVELDIQATKDGVLILMHDATLSRMTDWRDVKGTVVNGIQLPTSNKVIDWTYEQIQQLHLREMKGTNEDGSYSAVTPFKVPTLVEALKVCKGRLLIIPDKTDKWHYAPNDGLDNTTNVYLYDAMKEANNYESIILSYGLTPMTAVSVQSLIATETGVVPLLMPRDNAALVSTYKYLESMAYKGSYGIHVGGTFNPEKTAATSATFQEWRKHIMLWGWTIDDSVDNATYWQQMYDLGYRMIMVNAYLDVVKYAANTCSFN